MTLLATIEASYYSRSKRSFYAKFILAAAIVLIVLSAIQFSGFGTKAHPRQLVDFDDFYIVGQMVWHGDIDKAYLVHSIGETQAAPSRGKTLLLWTYPPQFDVLVAALALTSRWIAYCLFIVGSFAAYLAILRRIATESFVLALIVTFPALVVEIRCGQNGFVTGALIGLTCLYLRRGNALAGRTARPDGDQAASRRCFRGIYPCHPPLENSLRCLRNCGGDRDRCDTRFGNAGLGGLLSQHKAGRLLSRPRLLPPIQNGLILCRRKNLRPSGIARDVCAGDRGGCCVHNRRRRQQRRFSLQQSLGLTAIASLLISPYAYDYDLPILGVGLALLLPDILQFGTAFERSLLYTWPSLRAASGLWRPWSWTHKAPR